jgi:hypothetical protein
MRSIVIIICLIATMFGAPAVAQQACPTLVVATNDDAVNGDTSSPCALIANPGPDGISLREALLAANNATGSGVVTITFAGALAGTTVALSERLAPITRSQITLTGLTNNGQPNTTLDATNASNPGSILFIATSNFTMSGINMINIPTNFNGMQIGGFDYNLTGQMISSPAQICCLEITSSAFSSSSGSGAFGVYIPANESNETIANVTIDNNSFSQLGEAINIQGGGPSVSNSVIQDVVIFGNTFSQMTLTATSAVEVSAGPTNDTVQRVQIVQNTFTDNFQGFVIDIGGNSSGNLVKDVTVARNFFSGGVLGIVAGDSNSNNNAVTNTQIVDNVVNLPGSGGATIQITDSQSGGTNDTVNGVSFVNNTIYNGSSSSPPGWGLWVNNNIGGVTGVSATNTIFWGNGSTPPLKGITSPSQVANSIINQTGFTGVNNNFNTDPLFVNTGSGDFRLQSGSPARSAGITAGAPAIDLDCQPRGSPPSIGAYEFDGPDICPAKYRAPLTGYPPAGPAPLAVTFGASDLPPPMTYTINFGDGTTGALAQSQCIDILAIPGGQGGIQCSGSASHIYTAAGSYSATLLNALGLTVGTAVITVTGTALNVSIALPNKATTLGSQTIPTMQNDPRLTLEVPFAISNATVPTISSFTASPASISPFDGGGSATLSWSVASATSLSISGVGAVIGNSIQVSPSQTTTYTLTASNAEGSTTAQTTVTVAGYRWRADPLSR